MYWFQVDNVFQSIRPLIIVLKVFGFIPIINHQTEASKKIPFWRSFLYTVCFGSLYLYAIVTYVTRGTYTRKYNSVILGRAETFFTVLFYSIIITSIGSAFANRNSNQQVLCKLHRMDQILKVKLRSHVDHQSIHLLMTVGVGCHFMMTMLICGFYEFLYVFVFEQLGLIKDRLLFHFICGFSFMLTMVVPIVQVLLLIARYKALNSAFR